MRSAMKLKKTKKAPIVRCVKTKRRIVDEAPLLFPEMSDNPWFTGPRKSADGHGKPMSGLTTLELCAGAGGQALGYEQAGIDHVGLVELNKHACATLRLNRPDWNVIEQDLTTFSGEGFEIGRASCRERV